MEREDLDADRCATLLLPWKDEDGVKAAAEPASMEARRNFILTDLDKATTLRTPFKKQGYQ
jgi:hypothetical protein